MGVSGCGKTSIGLEIAGRLNLDFFEGDALHPIGNIQKMWARIPLTDEDRWPWLDLIGQKLRNAYDASEGMVISCSALKKSYRDRLRDAAAGRLIFIFLEGSRAALQDRLSRRRSHFFPPELLDSQLAALENPSAEPFVVTVNIDQPLDAIVDSALSGLAKLDQQEDPHAIAGPTAGV